MYLLSQLPTDACVQSKVMSKQLVIFLHNIEFRQYYILNNSSKTKVTMQKVILNIRNSVNAEGDNPKAVG